MKQFFTGPALATILSQFVIDKDQRRDPGVNISTEFGGNWWCHREAFGTEDEDQLELFRRLGQVLEVGFWAGLRQLLAEQWAFYTSSKQAVDTKDLRPQFHYLLPHPSLILIVYHSTNTTPQLFGFFFRFAVICVHLL